MFKEQNFCHIASNNRNNVKVGVFVYRTSDDLATVTVSGYFNERIIDINLHDIIIHEKIDPVDSTVVQRNTLCVVKRTVDNVETKEIHSAWEELTDQAIQDIQNTLANLSFSLNDLTDVNINNVQTGDYLRWNGAEWINMAGGGGGSAVWGSISGDIADQADLQSALAGKADVTDLANKANVDMDNLTDTGANIANWSHNVTNCITEISQDIKIEVSGNTATLKAGSKLYKADGTYITTTVDDSTSVNIANSTYFFYYNIDTSNFGWCLATEIYSQAVAPTATQYMLWYDTTNNVVKHTSDYGSTWSTCALPLGRFATDNNIIIKYWQAFNGFGWVGEYAFVLPGVKGLAPNGKNPDDSLISTPISITAVTITSLVGTASQIGFLSSTGIIRWGNNKYYEQDYEPYRPDLVQYDIWYDTRNGYIQWFDGTDWVKEDWVFLGKLGKESAANIKDLPNRSAFQALDRNDMVGILNTLYPVGSIYIGTQNFCPLRELIPGSKWGLVAVNRALWGCDGTNPNTTIAAGLPNINANLNCGNTINSAWVFDWANGAFTVGGGNSVYKAGSSGAGTSGRLQASFVASNSNSTYGSSSTVQPPAYRVNVWRRTE